MVLFNYGGVDGGGGVGGGAGGVDGVGGGAGAYALGSLQFSTFSGKKLCFFPEKLAWAG